MAGDIGGLLEKAKNSGLGGALEGSNNVKANPQVMNMISSFPPEKILVTIIFSLLGTAYLIYGKKTSQFTMIISGIVLMALTYMLTNAFHLFLAGSGIAVLPFLLKNMD